MIFSIVLNDTPCQIDVTHYEPAVPDYKSGHPDGWEEGWGGEICWDVLDMAGNPATELEAQLTDAIRADIEDQIETLYQELADEARLP